MLDQFDRYGAKLTILADVAEILKFKEYKEATGRDDFQNGFEDVAVETLAAEEVDALGETDVETTQDRFEDVTLETIAEEADEQAGATEDEIFPEAQAELEMEMTMADDAPAAAESAAPALTLPSSTALSRLARISVSAFRNALGRRSSRMVR